MVKYNTSGSIMWNITINCLVASLFWAGCGDSTTEPGRTPPEIIWEQPNGSPGAWVTDIAINSSGDIFAGTAGVVLRSTDNGDNWTDVSTGLTTAGVTSFAFNPSGQIFAGTINGVFRSVKSTI